MTNIISYIVIDKKENIYSEAEKFAYNNTDRDKKYSKEIITET